MGTERGREIHAFRQRTRVYTSDLPRSQSRRIAVQEGLSDMTMSTQEMDREAVVIPLPDRRDLSVLDGPTEAELAEIALAEVEPEDYDDYVESILGDMGPEDDGYLYPTDPYAEY